MKNKVLIVVGLAVTALVIKNTIDIYYFKGAASEILYYLHQETYDRQFASIVERDLYDLDDEGEN